MQLCPREKVRVMHGQARHTNFINIAHRLVIILALRVLEQTAEKIGEPTQIEPADMPAGSSTVESTHRDTASPTPVPAQSAPQKKVAPPPPAARPQAPPHLLQICLVRGKRVPRGLARVKDKRHNKARLREGGL